MSAIDAEARTLTGWYVPGAYVDLGNCQKIHLVPPTDWHRLVLSVPRVPPSMNTDERRHWRTYYKLKRDWQSELELLLMAMKAPKDCSHALCGASLRFPTRHKRDAGNFAGVIEKALGDALQAYRVIPDDDAAHYLFVGAEIDQHNVGSPQTDVYVYLRPTD